VQSRNTDESPQQGIAACVPSSRSAVVGEAGWVVNPLPSG